MESKLNKTKYISELPIIPSVQPIPDSAKKVFQGKIFDVYQWQQEVYDGSFQTFEKLSRTSTVIIIPVTDDKKILVAEQEQPGKAPFTGLVGGRAEEGESPWHAAERELLEETGLRASELEFFDCVQPTSKIDWKVYTFIARDLKKVAEQDLDTGEKIDLKEYSWEDFLQLTFSDSFGEIELSLKLMRAAVKSDDELLEIKKHILGL